MGIITDITTWVQNGGQIADVKNGKHGMKHCRDLRKLCNDRRTKWRGIWQTHICMREDGQCKHQRIVNGNGNGRKAIKIK